jgi:hypothetical protein
VGIGTEQTRKYKKSTFTFAEIMHLIGVLLTGMEAELQEE